MVIVVLELALAVPVWRHASAASPDYCSDELRNQWNQFAADANAHMQIVESKEEARKKTHARLEREWTRMTGLECW